MNAYPLYSLIGAALIVNLFIVIITKIFTDQAKMKELKAKQKEYNKQLKEFKHDVNKTLEIQKEMMSHSMELMRHSFKPLLITFLPLILIFGWFSKIYNPIYGKWWILYYIIASIFASIIFRKVLDVA